MPNEPKDVITTEPKGSFLRLINGIFNPNVEVRNTTISHATLIKPLGIILKGLINLICSVSFFFFKESAFFKTISAIFYIVFLFVSSIKILAKSSPLFTSHNKLILHYLWGTNLPKQILPLKSGEVSKT